MKKKIICIFVLILLIVTTVSAMRNVNTERLTWYIETVDSTGDVGRCNSIALDTGGYPHISYYDNTNRDLKYAYKDAGGWHNQTVDSTSDIVGMDTSIALDTDDYPHISYWNGTNEDLKYATVNQPPGAPTITGPTSGKVGKEIEFTFNAVDPDGDNVKYHIDWDDGDSDETGLYPSGEDVKVKHTWDSDGTYTIRAYAEDEFGLVGPEGTLTVTMPRNRATSNVLFYRLLEQFPLLQKLLLLQR
jgi:uncharacterized protein YxeA